MPKWIVRLADGSEQQVEADRATPDDGVLEFWRSSKGDRYETLLAAFSKWEEVHLFVA